MYHIYSDEEAVNAFVLRLLNAEPFRNGTYTLYADVPVKCLGYEYPYFTSVKNLSTMDSSTAAQTVDFIVTKGIRVMLGITTELLAARSRKLFSTVLQTLPQIEVSPGGALPRKYRNLYFKVRDRLETLEREDPSPFTLRPFPVELSPEELTEISLLNPSGNTNAYGRAHGLFFRCGIRSDGTLERHPISSTAAFRDYLKAANWGSQSGSCDALQALLDTSISSLFSNHPEVRSRFNEIMEELSKLQSCPVFVPNDILEDYPAFIYRLRCCVADGNPENRQIMELSEALLHCISQVLADEQTAACFEILRVPLHAYFEEASVRSGLYYPHWLYRQSVLPYLNTERFCSTCTLRDLLRHRNSLSDRAPFPSLMELLVLPLYMPAAARKCA